VIIGEYSPRRSRGDHSPIITEPEANNCFSIFTQVFCVFGPEFVLISLISLSVTYRKQLTAILKISILLYLPVGEYNSLIRQI
jgi:NADH:ubiquinone oxidoreductase subunit 3 (subunit A)